MAHHPCGPRPPLLVAVDPEQAGEPVEIGLQVAGPRPGEPEEVAPKPRAQVVHQRHRLQVDGVPHVRPVRLVGAPGRPHEGRVRALHVVHDDRARRDVRQQRVLDTPRRRLPVPAHDCHGVLGRVDGDGDTDLVLRQAPLPDEVGASRDVGVGGAGLVDPDPAAQNQPVLVAVDGGEDPVAPLERRLVGYPVDLGGEVERGVVAHAGDEALPDGEGLLPVLEDGAGGRRAGGAACRAAPALMAGRGPPVPARAGVPAGGARRARAPQPRGLVERPGPNERPAPALRDGIAEGGEVLVAERRDHAPAGVGGDHGSFLFAQAATQPGMSPNIGPDGHLGKSTFGTAKGITSDGKGCHQTARSEAPKDILIIGLVKIRW